MLLERNGSERFVTDFLAGVQIGSPSLFGTQAGRLAGWLVLPSDLLAACLTAWACPTRSRGLLGWLIGWLAG